MLGFCKCVSVRNFIGEGRSDFFASVVGDAASHRVPHAPARTGLAKGGDIALSGGADMPRFTGS